MRFTFLAAALALQAVAGGAGAQTASPAAPAASAPGASTPIAPLEPSTRIDASPRGDAARRAPIILQAQSISGQPGLQTVAEGAVEFRRGGLVIKADRIAYDLPEDKASAKGGVRIERDGQRFSGPELELRVQRFEGFFLEPQFEFLSLGAGGSARRIDFLGPGKSSATDAQYTSCPRDGPTEPDWVLKADRVTLDTDANEGTAEGAVLRFLGTPILALPTLSFPLGDARKSGWLPPSVNIDNRSGLELTVPYYWNIAPNRDATIAPRVITRRGFGVEGEFRYLDERYDGELRVDALPNDRVADRSRGSLAWQHAGMLPWGIRARADVARVSDDEWWRDFPNRGLSLTTRLLAGRLSIDKPFGDEVELANGNGGFGGLAYARTVQWQVLQGSDSPIVSPYERSPQVGVRAAGALPAGLRFGVESEFNRFTLPGNDAGTSRGDGERVHLLGSISRPWRAPGWFIVPRLSVNGATYRAESLAAAGETRGRASRTIPTFSIDSGLELERGTEAFGRALRQTLEPRVLYINTPFREQSNLPNFDSAAKDFNFVSIYSDNAFSGVDRVSDSHQITAGVTTRLIDAASGAEALRLGLVQRYLLRTQRVAPQADGSPDGPPLTQRFSDALLLGSTNVLPGWNLDAAVQYSPDIQRAVRSVAGARYSPGPYRTVGATYRFARGLSEQMEIAWQWPLLERAMRERGVTSDGCKGSWYSVGRVNYSLKDSRITDSVLGVEYDAGCWIGRFVAERLSTGRREATTRLLIQLELIGLSRLGSNPLKVLQDNIPGYQRLRDEREP